MKLALFNPLSHEDDRLTRQGATASALPHVEYSNLTKELDQCKECLLDFPMPTGKNHPEKGGITESFCLPREVPLSAEQVGCVSAPLTSTEVRNVKKRNETFNRRPDRVSRAIRSGLGTPLLFLGRNGVYNEYLIYGRGKGND